MTDSNWSRVTIGEIASVKTGPFGSALHESDYRTTGTPIVTVEHLSERGLVHRNLPRVGAADVRRLSAYRCEAGDILFSRVGSVDRNSLVSADEDGWLFSGRLLRVRVDPRRVHPPFLSQLFGTERFKETVRSVAVGQTMASLNTQILKGISLELPGLGSQILIAEALNAADETITAMEVLIAKKRAMKQGVMQQLLNGRSRLPGFTTEWNPVLLREVGATYGGLVGKTKEDFGTGVATFVTFMEVMHGARLLGRRLERVSVRPHERQNRVLRGDVLFNGSSETPEEVALAAVVDYDPAPTTYLNSFCFGYRLKARFQIDPTYLAYYFRSGAGRLAVSALAQGATRYNIAKTKLLDLSPVLPPIDEQRAIVDVLRDSEAEIDVLHARLAKAQAIKTGMMQQLLTGRTRLPVETTP